MTSIFDQHKSQVEPNSDTSYIYNYYLNNPQLELRPTVTIIFQPQVKLFTVTTDTLRLLTLRPTVMNIYHNDPAWSYRYIAIINLDYDPQPDCQIPLVRIVSPQQKLLYSQPKIKTIYYDHPQLILAHFSSSGRVFTVLSSVDQLAQLFGSLAYDNLFPVFLSKNMPGVTLMLAGFVAIIPTVFFGWAVEYTGFTFKTSRDFQDFLGGIQEFLGNLQN